MTIQQCPVCQAVVGVGTPVQWDLVINGQQAIFQLRCCAVDATLCSIFPTLKDALFHSPPAVQLLGKLLGGG